ncbi:MAG: hypothetical protein II992_03220 [Lachnospiraceae bacterium]|nr:hypothetical protein [Lachnospiraceae bacterium]
MKKLRNIIILSFVIMTACMLQSKDVKAEEVGAYTMSDEESNSDYDVTGDGVADTVQFEKITEQDEHYRGYKVIINGETVLDNSEDTWWYYSLEPVYIQTEDHGYFFISTFHDNDDGERLIYEYVDGKLEKRMDLLTIVANMFYHDSIRVSSVKENAINLKVTGQSDMLAHANINISLKVKSDGNLSLKNKVVKVTYSNKRMGTEEVYTSKYLVAAKKIQVYKGKTGTKKAFSIKKGTKLKIKKVSLRGKNIRFYCVTKSGKKGWIKSKYNLFKDLMYAG